MPRIIAGIAKGRVLKMPKGEVRPATARARTALFDYLSNIIAGKRVIDLYCGSGALGLEALSRGASESWFVDIARNSIEAAKSNADTIGFKSGTTFIKKDVFQFLKSYAETGKFDLVFAAPPYKIAEPTELLNAIRESGLLQIGGSVCMEYARHNDPPNSDDYELDRRKVYGETIVDVWDLI